MWHRSRSSRSQVHIVWPQVWESLVRKRRRAAVTIIPALVVLLVACGVFLIRIDEAPTGYLAFACLPLLLAGGFYGHATAVNCRDLETSLVSLDHISGPEPDAVTLAQSSRATVAYRLMVVAGVLAVAFLMFLADDITPYGAPAILVVKLAPLMPLLVVVPVATLFSRVVRKRKQLGLGLSPRGVYTWTWFGCCFFDWEWIADVRAIERRQLLIELDVHEPLQRPLNPEENWIGQVDLFRRRRTKIQAGFLAVNPAAAFYALCFYHRHPELRHELGTQAGVDRIRGLDFPDVYDEVRRYGDVKATPRTA